VLIVKCAAIL